MNLNRKYRYVIILCIFIISLIIYLYKKFSNPLLFGIDGPYYYIQVRSILSTGYIKYPDPPLAFYILALFSLFTHDIILGIKIGSVFIMLLSMFIVYFLVRNVYGELAGYGASLLYVFSPYLARLSVDFLKNSMGLLFLISTIFFYHKSIKNRNINDAIISSVFLILTGLTHILDFGTAFAIILIFFILSFNKEELRYLLIPLLTGFLLIVLGFLYNPVMGGDTSRILLLINDILYRRIGTFNIFYSISIIFPVILGISGSILASKSKIKYDRNLLLAFSILLILFNIPIYPYSHLFRLNLMTAILAPFVIGSLISSPKDLLYSVVVILILSSIFMSQFNIQMMNARPSISLEEYNEIKYLISILPNNTSYIVPDVRLKYWVETFGVEVFRKPYIISQSSNVVFIIEILPNIHGFSLKHNKPIFRPPPNSKLIFKGRFIEAYIIHK